MDHTRLKTFQIVSDLLSFRKASQQLHLTQPAVTAQIKALEESLGVALFLRTGRNVALTQAGETLLEYARRIEDLKNQAVAALAEYTSQDQSEIGIGASQAIAVGVLSNILPRLLKASPRLRARVVTGSHREILQAVAARRLHLAVVEGDAAHPGVRVEVLGRDELVLIVPADHAWTRKQKLSSLELIEEPIILAEPGSGARTAIEDYLRKEGVLAQVRCVAAINSTEATIAAVEAGLGVGFVPRLALGRSTSPGSVKGIPIENGPVFQALNLVLPEGPRPQGPVWRIISLLRESFSLDTPHKPAPPQVIGPDIEPPRLRNALADFNRP